MKRKKGRLPKKKTAQLVDQNLRGEKNGEIIGKMSNTVLKDVQEIKILSSLSKQS